jgi:hypothetical protein
MALQPGFDRQEDVMRTIMLALFALALVGPSVAVADCAGYMGPGPCSAGSGSSFDGLAGFAAGPSGAGNENLGASDGGANGAQPSGSAGADYGLDPTSGSGGQAYGGPGSACYAGLGGPCYAGAGGNARACPPGCR